MVSVNQVRHLFVVDSLIEDTTTDEGVVIKVPVSEKGEVKVCKSVNGDVYLQYMGEGGLLTSDYIKPGQVISTVLTSASDAQVKMKEAHLTLKNGIVAGADYIVDVEVSNYIAMADESTLVKFGAVHATSSMTEPEFYVALAKSFVRNFSRDINKFFKFYLTTDSSREEVTMTSTHDTENNTYTGIVIAELPQTSDYVRGEFGVTTVNFKVVPHTIIEDGDEVCPFETKEDGTVNLEESASLFVGNGYEIADTEYFCMGERGDIYRQMGYPRTIRTKYMVDETQEYDVLDIAFYFVGRGIDAQKSEKHLTLVEISGGGVLAEVKASLENLLQL